MKKRLALILAAMMVFSLVAGCGGEPTPSTPATPDTPPASDTPQTPDTPAVEEPLVLRVATTDTPDTKNPITTLGMGSKQVYSRQVYEVLFDYDQNLEIVPILAKSWEVSEDGLTWTFHLRDDVYWHDGEKFTADDVVYTYKTVKEMELGVYYSTIGPIHTFEKVDDYTVKFITDAPMVNMVSAMLYIVPQHIFSQYDTVDKMSAFANEEMIGTGPYKHADSAAGEYVKYVLNEDYWGELPVIDELIYVFFANPDTVVQAFESGEVDFIEIEPAQLEYVQKLDYAGIHTYDQLGFTEIAFNCWDDPASNGNPLMLDPTIRTALDWAIDRDKIIEYAKNGLATTTVTIIPDSAGKWHWQPEGDELRTYNPEKAMAQLEAAGYIDRDGDGVREDANGNKLSFRFTCMEKHRETGLILQSNWKAIGVETTIEFCDSARQTELVYSENFNTDILIWGWGVKHDPSYMLFNMTTDAIGGNSDCNYSNPVYDQMYLEQNSEMDEEKRLEIVHEMQKIIYNDAPYIPLYMEYYVEVYRADRWEGWEEWPLNNTIMSVYMLKHVKPVQ